MPYGAETIDRLRALLAARQAASWAHEERRLAAVLIPLFLEGGVVHIVLAKRSNELRRHAGEIAFPGGGADPEDSSLEHTALREAEEEVGIRQDDVDVLGALDDMATAGSGYVIRPFVGVIPHPYPLVPDGLETVRVLTPPLHWFDEPARFREEVRERRGVSWPVHYYDVEEDVVWGATARMLTSLIGLIEGRAVSPPPYIPIDGPG